MQNYRFMSLMIVLALVLSVAGMSMAQDDIVVRVWTGSSSPVEMNLKKRRLQHSKKPILVSPLNY